MGRPETIQSFLKFNHALDVCNDTAVVKEQHLHCASGEQLLHMCLFVPPLEKVAVPLRLSSAVKRAYTRKSAGA